MNTVIISDVHIGCRYFLRKQFLDFVRSISNETSLVLNGDSVDNSGRHLQECDKEVLDVLRQLSLSHRVIWVRGNHDASFTMADPGRIEFCKSYSIGKRLIVAHGYDFDTVMPRNRPFIVIFRTIHRLRISLGAPAVHVAFYAKKFPLFYNVLRKTVSLNAVQYAKENGYEAVTCGHTHYVDDTVLDGVRYINTGSWTETPLYYLRVDETTMGLVAV
jgi:UDP-2,3-diacylglucosamine pyrophosphatase LpxH